MKILCTICFKKNSYGLKNKNFLKFIDKPLYQHTYEVAKKIKNFNNIILLTDKKIDKINSSSNTILVNRPKNLSDKYTAKIDVILYAMKKAEIINNIKYDAIVDLDVTSPLRTVADIKNCIKIFKKKNPLNLFSVNISRKNPYFNMVEKRNKTYRLIKNLKKYSARQKTPKVYDMNASIYIWRRDTLLKKQIFTKKTEIYEMPFERSVDIDTKSDFNFNKFVFNYD